MEKKITFGAKIMYALLCDYASSDDYCWPSHPTLAKRLSCSVTSVKKYLAELVNEKLIDIRRGQYHYSNDYYLLRPASLKAREAKTGHIQPKADRQQPESDRTQPKVGYINTLKNQKERKEPPLPPAPAPGNLPPASGPVGGGGFSFQDFEKLWEAYPKKDAKGFALLAWKQLRQTGQLPPLPDILAAIKRFMLTESWQRGHGRYIPQLSNFLRGQRWLDPLSPEEEEANRNRQEVERMELARKREQEADEARREEKRERLRPLYNAFAEKFGGQASQPNERIDAMNFGLWMFLEGKYGGPSAADVPDGNTLSVYDFMKAYQRRCDEAAQRAARPAHNFHPDSRERNTVNRLEMPQRGSFLARLIPAAQPLCAAV
ncbi:MAG: helix-turn-helix domain-containing protein [Desulfovibrio sp.]|nr:helix-turn-helix domain-containing protein [Desulfovibrio sp.]